MIRRPLLATTAAMSALVLCTAGSAAAAATTAAKPAVGSATSNLNLLSVSAGGHAVSVGNLALTSSTLTGSSIGKAVITPLVVDGTAYGQQTVTPAASPVTVASQSTPSALASILSVASPAFSASASNAPSSHAGTSSLGSFKVLGLTVPVQGAVDLGSAVSAKTGAVGQKTVVVKNLALPSIADLLGALGLDLSKLPVGTLTSLANQLGIATSAVNSAQAAVDSAQAAVNTATSSVTSKTATLSSATAALAAAQTALVSATTAVQTKLNAVTGATLAAFPTANTIAGYGGLSAPGVSAVELVSPGTAAAYTNYTNAQTAASTATAAVATAQAAVNAAQALLTSALATLASAISTALGLVTAVLDGTPLVSLGSLNVTSRAVASSAKAGGQQAVVVGGTVSGLKVLGTDVLDTVLGSTSINVLDLVGSKASAVNAAISTLTGTLSSVLSTVPGLPKLSIPAPQISVLTKSATTAIAGGFGTANTTVQGLRITIPAITLPSSIALPGAANLPALAGVTQQVAGLLSTAPISVGIATLSDQASFRPAVLASSTPTAPGVVPQLPKTGLPVGVAVVSMMLIGGALVLRRRSVSAS